MTIVLENVTKKIQKTVRIKEPTETKKTRKVLKIKEDSSSEDEEVKIISNPKKNKSKPK
jgi:hypothetical protein